MSFRSPSAAREPESIVTSGNYGFRARRFAPKSAIADLGTKIPISGKPEIGGPGMTAPARHGRSGNVQDPFGGASDRALWRPRLRVGLEARAHPSTHGGQAGRQLH